MLNNFLFKQVDNSALITFRIFFGILIALECFGATLTGWIHYTLIEPQQTFNFIGFDFLQPLPGNGMYYYYIVMGILGVFISIGYKYRASMFSFAVLWTATYLMQKTSYNNHYYLLVLLSWMFIFLPAEKYHSVDVKNKPHKQHISMPNWCKWLLITQVFIVYTYAAIAKIYPDWLDLSVAKILFSGKVHYPIVGELFQTKGFHYFITYSGILFDFLVIPLLLWKRTRVFMFFLALFFHLFNSIVFQIGIFPYLALAISLFFFEEKTIRNIFLKRKPFYEGNEINTPKTNTIITGSLILYIIIQFLLPLRHHLIKGNVLFTEEAHRMSWRMMLRSKSGYIQFTTVDKTTKERTRVKLQNYLSKKQRKRVATHPDMIWQFAQRLKKEANAQGKNIEVYATGKIRVNNHSSQALVNSKVDLAAAKWDYFWHNEWILQFNPKKKPTRKKRKKDSSLGTE